MAANRPDELEAFQLFAQEQLDNDSYGVVASILNQYRLRQDEIRRLREEIRPAVAQSERGESREIDFEQLKSKGRQRLAEEGISD